MLPTETHLMWHDLVVESQTLPSRAQNDLTHTDSLLKNFIFLCNDSAKERFKFLGISS